MEERIAASVTRLFAAALRADPEAGNLRFPRVPSLGSGRLSSRGWYPLRQMSPERPQIEKPEGDIPFELGIEDIVVGDGDEATRGCKVTVHYVGVAFSTGEEFDASWNRAQPFAFKLGKGQVIPGWDAGVEGMRVGGRRRLTIPSAMAYGARGAGGVIPRTSRSCSWSICCRWTDSGH